MSFTHLQVRSGYSLMESTMTIEKLVKQAKKLQFTSLALTDHNVLYGSIEFYKTCLTYNIKPLLGMMVTIIHKDATEGLCVLLAKNNEGYQQLIHLSTFLNIHHHKGIPFSQLDQYTDHVICILPMNEEKLLTLLAEQRIEDALTYIRLWQSLFNTNDFYIGIQDRQQTNDHNVHQAIKIIHDTYDIPVVATNDVAYLHEQDYLAYNCLQAIKAGKRWSTTSEAHNQHRYLRSAEEMTSIFSHFLPEAITNTKEITNKCHVTFEFNEPVLPSYPVPDQKDAHTYLKEICWTNMSKMYKEVTPEIEERLTYELDVIHSMNFSDYFLIVWDFVSYAKKKNIFVGPGRGSAAGSLVAYILGITNVDPIKYNLLFERFLNPERVSMPDIDIDFSDHRRDEVIDYVRKKYGEQHVAQIITFGTFAARSLLRDLFKTIGIDQNDVYFILNHISSQSNKTIAEHIYASDELREYIKQSKKLRLLFKIATTLEGLPRHISTHAAGVVMSDEQLTKHVPLTVGSHDTYMTQYAMNDLEAIGLLKMDFLGLRNLTLIERIVQSINRSTQEKSLYVHTRFPDNDTKTFKLLQAGQTNGIFQLESQGMKQVLTQLKPTTLEDIIAVNALYRPGPMSYIPTYIKRKFKEEHITYPHKDLEPILEKTYGVLIYQEQIMQIAHQFAGFSLGDADLLRRAISQKKRETITNQQEAFIQGCLANGYTKEVAEEVFKWIVKFSNYGFNRSHAVAYSKISYQLAYLKAHYPTHFFAELLTSVANQHEKVYLYIKEARQLNVSIVPPHINKSFGKYTVENNKIRMGLLAIKGVGYQVVKEIVRARKERNFKNLFDFCLRVSLKIVNRKVIENLIMAGAFDDLYNNRASLLASLGQAIEQGMLFREFHDQPSLLEDHLELKAEYTPMDEFSQMKKLADEKELLGMYISSHPLSEYRRALTDRGYLSMNDVQHRIGQRDLLSVGIVQAIKKIRTRRGDPMAFLTLSDEHMDMEAVVFPELYRMTNRWLQEEMIITIRGSIEKRNNRLQWILNDIQPFEMPEITITNQQLFIQVTNDTRNQALAVIHQVSRQYPGHVPIYIHHKEMQKTYKLSSKYSINPHKKCLQMLHKSFGEKHVVLKQSNETSI